MIGCLLDGSLGPPAPDVHAFVCGILRDQQIMSEAMECSYCSADNIQPELEVTMVMWPYRMASRLHLAELFSGRIEDCCLLLIDST